MVAHHEYKYEETAMFLKIGNSAKNSTYLSDLINQIKEKTDHPRNKGVKMQAHHAISATAMKMSGLGNDLVKLGYDINALENLVFIPCTLQGACHLGVQPHRGNHEAAIKPSDDIQNDYDDDMEPKKYHDIVSRRLLHLKLPLSKECIMPEDQKTTAKNINKLSSDIIDEIQENPGGLPLTSIAEYFAPDRNTGCGGHYSIPIFNKDVAKKKLAQCPNKRDHFTDDESKKRGVEKINYKKNIEFKLEAGK